MGIYGLVAVLAACALTVGGAVAATTAARRGDAAMLRQADRMAYLVFALMTVATAVMVLALVTHDFSVEYVSQVGSRSTPTLYTVISLWGALEGSLLLWGWILALFTALVAWRTPVSVGVPLKGYALAVLLAIGTFFTFLLIGPASPFGTVSPVPLDGPGPNPLLQNHWLMAVHPPLLYLGYVGMSVPFAFAMASLLSGRVDADWIRLTRRWTLWSWLFLSAAIVAGMWWAYAVLGWGGYWAWDPVENASFMPWLTATAFLHSVMVQQRRGMLRVWNLNLVIATFLLTILGTFITRSGILSSVHAFASGEIGYYFLGFIALTLLFSVTLLAGRSTELRSEGRLDGVVSRDTVFLVNNLLLTVFTFTVLLGTMFPLVAEAFRDVKVSVGAPFFNRMTTPISVSLIFLMGVGPALPWRRAIADDVRRKLLKPAIAMLVTAIAAVALGVPSIYGVLAFAFGAFAAVSNGQEFVAGARARMRAHGERAHIALGRLVRANRHRYGGYVAHMGVVVFAVGIAASSEFRQEHQRTMRPGDTVSVAGYDLRLERIWAAEEPQRAVVGVDVAVSRAGRSLETMNPRLNFYRSRDEPVPTPAVRSRMTDLYLNLMAFEADGSRATITILIEPLVSWIWTGGGIVVLGVSIALWPERAPRTPSAPVRVPGAAAARPAVRRREAAAVGGD
jgi:cytochrome c-type biogenesis protein CcmF